MTPWNATKSKNAAITHIYGLERLMSDSKIHSSSLILASFLHSALHFLSKADAFNIFPYKVKPLMAPNHAYARLNGE